MMQPPTRLAMYRNKIVTPDAEFEFNESDLNVPLLGLPSSHVNNSKNHIPIRSSVYNMFYPSGRINREYKKTTFNRYGLSLGVVRKKIFKQFIENSINILPPEERPTARAKFEDYDKIYREQLLKRSRIMRKLPINTSYNTPVSVGKRQRT